MTTRTLLQAVAEVARVTGAVALEHFGRDLLVESKADGSPVSEADRAAERAAREWIERRFPGDGVLGEELGLTRPDAARRWILDPIDGTKSFLRRVPLWGTLVAVAEGGRVLAGAAFFPATGELVAAARGEGCWWNDRRCRVSSVATLDQATVLVTDDTFPERHARRDAWQRLASQAALARTWGDAYGYLLVATGRAEAMADDVVSSWDAAPFDVIAAEAGGVLTDWTGAPTAFGGDLIVTNRALDRAVREILVDAVARAEHPSLP